MPASKAKVIENLSQVKNLGESYATAAYEDLGVRNLDDLIEAAKAKKLQEIKGIGAAKEKKILASAEELKAETQPAPTPEKKSKSKKSGGSKSKKSGGSKGKKSGGSKKADTGKKEAPKKEAPKKDAPKKEAPKKEAPKKEASKTEAKPSSSKPSNGQKQRPRTTYRPPQPKSRPSLPGLLFKLGKKIIGRILG